MIVWQSRLKAYNRIGPHHPMILEIIFGTLLGDSHAERRSYTTKNGVKLGSTRISFQQENNNVEYLMWLWKTLRDYGYCSTIKPSVKTRMGRGGKGRRDYIRRYYRFHTFTFSSFDWIHDLFYPDGITKVIPNEIGDFLTPLALACWIMDDGTKIQNSLKISTHSFSKENLEMVQKVLLDKYKLETTLQSAGAQGKTQYVLYIRKSSMVTLKKIIKPYLVKSMLYKLGE